MQAQEALVGLKDEPMMGFYDFKNFALATNYDGHSQFQRVPHQDTDYVHFRGWHGCVDIHMKPGVDCAWILDGKSEQHALEIARLCREKKWNVIQGA